MSYGLGSLLALQDAQPNARDYSVTEQTAFTLLAGAGVIYILASTPGKVKRKRLAEIKDLRKRSREWRQYKQEQKWLAEYKKADEAKSKLPGYWGRGRGQ